MITSPSPVRVPKPFLNIPTDHKKQRVGDLELQAQLMEKLIPNSGTSTTDSSIVR